MIIALDGPAASGKGTISKLVAQKFDLYHLNSGNIYRALALLTVNSNLKEDNFSEIVKLSRSIDLDTLNSPELKNDHLAILASKISKNDGVRFSLLEFQRFHAKNPPFGIGTIIEGRDIGTVVFPNADIKFFLNADVEVRAKRRYKELKLINNNISLDSVRNELVERDNRDYNRRSSPLKPAIDAHLVNTTKLDIDESFGAICKIVEEHMAFKL